MLFLVATVACVYLRERCDADRVIRRRLTVRVQVWADRRQPAMEQEEQSRGSPDFATLLRRHRLNAGLSQEALAERARISVNGLGSLERGTRRSPRRDTVALLSQALELDATERHAFEFAATLSSAGRANRPVTVGPWEGPSFASLPFSLDSFVGRDREVAEIAALVRSNRMVTLTGAGGVGKTQTALHVAESVEGIEHRSVRFVGLASITDPLQVVLAIAAAAGVQEVPNRPLLDTLSANLRNKSMLFILDNCEHVIAEVAVVVEALLNACPKLRFLATSREALRAGGEHAYRLPTLEVPSPDVAKRLTTAGARKVGAITLFCDRARAVDSRFELMNEGVQLVAEICRRLDGIPLAIELAAARVGQLSLKTIVESLRDRYRILTLGSRTALPRQQTMRAAIDWSFNLLGERERIVFLRLSIFAGGCTLETAARVCEDEQIRPDDVFEIVGSLVERSLITSDTGYSETRYFLFETFRQYAREGLRERGEGVKLSHRHARVYCELAPRSASDPYDTKGAFSRIRVEEELDNWRAALHWTLNERGDVPLGQRLAADSFGMWRDHSVEGRSWITT
ncbi:MAG TPA: helix-turn-helix domain-containing protein, partial [Candidatus Tumulicola sp.]